MYAHARALRPAVAPAPGSSGLVLDLDTLARIAEDGASPVQARPHLGPCRPPPTAPDQARPAPVGPVVPLAEVVALLRDIVALVSALVTPRQANAAPGLLAQARAGLELLADFADGPREPSRTIREIADDLAGNSRESF